MPGNSDHSRLEQDWMGGSVQPGDHSGPMECQRERKSHQCAGVDSCIFALQAFTKGRTEIHVLMRVDNRATQAQINKMGGPRSKDLLKITQEVWQYCLSRKITITAEYLAGVQNIEADYQSRVFTDSSNWQLNPQVVHQIENILGSCAVDFFADRLNIHKEKYVSWKPDPHAMTVDAFSSSWRNLEAYTFPTFCLIGKCLSKIAKDQVTVILITPT